MDGRAVSLCQVYNGVLLVVAAVAAFGLRTTLEGRIAIRGSHCFGAQCGASDEGRGNVPVVSLLSYTLYSMALHAYHVPLAVLVAWWMSPRPSRCEGRGTHGMDHAQPSSEPLWWAWRWLAPWALIGGAEPIQPRGTSCRLSGDLVLRTHLTVLTVPST